MTTKAAPPLHETGRKLVIVVVVVVLAVSVFSSTGFMLTQGTTRVPQQVLRLALTVVLCIFLLRRAAWARWTSAVLFLVGGLLSVGAGFTLLGTPASAWVVIGIGAIYLYCAGLLIASRSVSAFFSQV